MSSTSVHRQRFLCQKLARDKLFERMLKEIPSATYQSRYLEKEEFKKALFDKLIEEANEVCQEGSNFELLKKELCDVLEVVDGLKHSFEIDEQKIQAYKLKKFNQRGSLKKGIFVFWILVCKQSDDYEYLLKNPEKYQIIKEHSTETEVCFAFNKLVRDNHWHFMSKGSSIFAKRLKDQDLLQNLFLKLQEEVSEVVSALDDEELAEELGDLLEVIEAIIFCINSSFEEIFKIKAQKAADFGEFKKGLWSEWVELPEGSRLFDYCSAHPEKYKKI